MDDDEIPWARLFDSFPVPISAVDPHGRQVRWNDAYREFLGYSDEELANIDVGRITRQDDQQWARAYLMRLAAGEIDEFVTDKIYIRRDGTEVAGRLMARALHDDDGLCRLIVAGIVPTESRRPADDAQIRRLLRYTTDTLTIVDADGQLIESTGRHTDVLGYPPSFWESRSIFDLVSEDDWPRIFEMRERVLGSPDEIIETEIEIPAADGSIQTLEVLAVNCLDDPSIGGIVLTSRNVTELRDTLAELSRQREAAEGVVDAQTRLLATVSHELRNPLHAVRGMAELLAAEELSPRAGELATSIVRQLSGLVHVTQDLLDAARFDAGKVEIHRAPTDLLALIDDVVSLGRASVGDRAVDVSSRVTLGVPPWVTTDVHRLRQVLGNLVGNAVKFTKEGSVQLVVRPKGERTLVFSVIDTGVGIPTDELHRVMQPFAVGTTAGDERGAGLGLSIVSRLITAMGGRIDVSSAAGEGSRFDVELPLAPAEPPHDVADPTLAADLVILVVEDNPVNQQLATSQLRKLGVVPVVAGTAEEGLELIDAEPDRFDLVLMDHQLPGMTGVEATEAIRALGGAVGRLPIVGLSASASAGDRDAFVEAGMDDFISKPASLDDLKRVMSTVLDATSSAEPVDAAATGETGTPDADLASPPLDIGVLTTLGDELGGSEVVVELVRSFLAELDQRTEAILSGLDAAEDTAERAAHTLKSSARLLGATDLADTCAVVEAGGRPETDLRELAARTETAMQGWLRRIEVEDR